MNTYNITIVNNTTEEKSVITLPATLKEMQLTLEDINAESSEDYTIIFPEELNELFYNHPKTNLVVINSYVKKINRYSDYEIEFIKTFWKNTKIKHFMTALEVYEKPFRAEGQTYYISSFPMIDDNAKAYTYDGNKVELKFINKNLQEPIYTKKGLELLYNNFLSVIK